MESLYRSGEAPKYDVHRMNQIESVHRIKDIGASPLGVPAADIPRRFTSGYQDGIRSGLRYVPAMHKTIPREV
jgi:hypothetical protein